MNKDGAEIKEGLGMKMIAGMIKSDAELLKNLLAQDCEADTIRSIVSEKNSVALTIEEVDQRVASYVFLLLKAEEYGTVENVLTEMVKIFPTNIRGLFEKIIEEWLVIQEGKKYKTIEST